MLDRFLYYWRRDTEAVWKIAYRQKTQGGILKNGEAPFTAFSVNKGFWAADPLVIVHDGKDYLFYEYYDERKRKGLIACSVMEEDGLSQPEIVLEEPFHLSFPFVFKVNEAYYMIPETGSQNKMLLYRCEQFPTKWRLDKILLEDICSSDTIVFSLENNMYCLASVLLNNRATEAENRLYIFEPEKKTLRYCCTSDNAGFDGVRNAGGLFQNGGRLIRPGQVGTADNYGKALAFFEVEKVSKNSYQEKIIGIIHPEDVSVKENKTYTGIHTYSCSHQYEYIDVKRMVKLSLIKRIKLMLIHIAVYCKQRVMKTV